MAKKIAPELHALHSLAHRQNPKRAAVWGTTTTIRRFSVFLRLIEDF